MKVSMNWLERWVDVDGLDPALVADRLTMTGLEVEGLEIVGEGLDDIVVGRIDAIEDHEKADKLVICKVDAGEGRQRTIVCGATNMSAGDLVPVALPGSQPPALDFEIGERKVLGVMSEGMLCAEEELGLADSSDGLWILPEDTELGVPVFEAMNLVDTVIHLGVTPNRPDALSHMGVAREVALLFEREFDPEGHLDVSEVEGEGGDVADVAGLQVDDTDGCPRYALAVMEGIEVGSSPDWLVSHLASIGVRSVNNIVDVTNFVLQDLGQPLHAFDLDKLDGDIVVRAAREGETITGIDHKEYKLTGEDLVIADESRPVAIAGVMGGEATEVTEATTRVLIECAYFDPTRVRKAAKRHGLHTESSHRFERGIDPNTVDRNLAVAVELMLSTQGDDATVRPGTIESYPAPIEPIVVEFDLGLYERIMGDPVTPKWARATFEGLGFAVADGDTWQVTVPTYRPDCTRPIDLVEELGRIRGFDKIEATFPVAPMGAEHVLRSDARHAPTLVPRELLRERVDRRALLTAQGLREAVGYSFMSAADLDRLSLAAGDERRDAIEVANPLTQDQAFMRTTLVPGLVRVLEHNVARRRADVALFEFGRTFHAAGETERLSILVTGPRVQHFTNQRVWDVFDVKGLVDAIARSRDVSTSWQVPDELEPFLHPGIQAQWLVDGEVVGFVGHLHPQVVGELEHEHPVVVAGIDLTLLDQAGEAVRRYVPQGRYPESKRDFAFLVDTTTTWADISAAMDGLSHASDGPGTLIRSYRIFDIYEGDQVPDGKRSLAMSVTYRSDERTLTDDDISALDDSVVAKLGESVGAQLR